MAARAVTAGRSLQTGVRPPRDAPSTAAMKPAAGVSKRSRGSTRRPRGPRPRPAAEIRQQLRAALVAYAGLWVLTGLGAGAGAVVGGATSEPVVARAGWSLWGEVVDTNLRLVAALGLAALVVQRAPTWRPGLDPVVALVVALSPLAVGAAIGAGGTRVAGALAHLPVEWAALAWGIGLYAAARARRLTICAGAAGAVVATALVIGAAAVEAWAPPG